MKDSNHLKKITGAIISSIIFEFFYIFFAGIIIYFQLTEKEKMPTLFFIFILTILFIPIIAIFVNLINRIKEIKGGEEDEASKY